MPPPSLRYLLVFALVLIVLRRFFAVPVSVGGSLVLTIVVWFIMSALMRERR